MHKEKHESFIVSLPDSGIIRFFCRDNLPSNCEFKRYLNISLQGTDEAPSGPNPGNIGELPEEGEFGKIYLS
jgi:hypothetical protein